MLGTFLWFAGGTVFGYFGRSFIDGAVAWVKSKLP